MLKKVVKIFLPGQSGVQEEERGWCEGLNIVKKG